MLEKRNRRQNKLLLKYVSCISSGRPEKTYGTFTLLHLIIRILSHLLWEFQKRIFRILSHLQVKKPKDRIHFFSSNCFSINTAFTNFFALRDIYRFLLKLGSTSGIYDFQRNTTYSRGQKWNMKQTSKIKEGKVGSGTPLEWYWLDHLSFDKRVNREVSSKWKLMHQLRRLYYVFLAFAEDDLHTVKCQVDQRLFRNVTFYLFLKDIRILAPFVFVLICQRWGAQQLTFTKTRPIL